MEVFKGQLSRNDIRKLLTVGLCGSLLTGIGDFLLGYGEEAEVYGLAESLMANAINMSDAQLIAGGLSGAIGLLLEGVACLAIYHLMAESSPGYARIYSYSIIAYIWLAPIGCHMNVGLMNIVYRYLFELDPSVASKVASIMIYGFCIPLWILLLIFWLPAMTVQFLAFAKGHTPYPEKAKWFSVFIGMWPALIISLIIGPHTALGAGIGTMFLSFGNAFMFGGLLCTLPGEGHFESFKETLKEPQTRSNGQGAGQ